MSNGDQLTYKITPEVIEGIHLIDRTIPGHKLKKATVTPAELAVPGLWQKVYEETLTTAATSKTISGLDGNTAEQYKIILRAINGYSGVVNYGIRPNNDSGANYGYECILGQGSTVTAGSETAATSLWFGRAEALNQLSHSIGILYAKSGYVRTMITLGAEAIAGTTITRAIYIPSVWNNTANNITSLVIYATQANGLGVGTFIGLYKRV